MTNNIRKRLMTLLMAVLVIASSITFASAQVIVTPPEPPDLVVPAARSGFRPASPRDGEEVTFDISVRNTGGPTRDAKVICVLFADRRKVAEEEFAFEMNAHSSHSVRWSVRMPAGRNVQLMVVAKARNDANPSNNRAVIQVRSNGDGGDDNPDETPAPDTPPDSTFKILDIGMKADAYENKGACPQTVGLGGWITVNGPGVVSYFFTRSDGAKGDVQRLTFDRAGTQKVHTTWTLGRNYEGWGALITISPTEMKSNKAPFISSCAVVGRAAQRVRQKRSLPPT